MSAFVAAMRKFANLANGGKKKEEKLVYNSSRFL
jgi:hypothetical protein